MTFYYLALVALLQMDEIAPKAISPHSTYDDCAIAQQKANKEYEDQLKTEESKALGLRFVCLKLMSDS
jgi:hypothetical protein